MGLVAITQGNQHYSAVEPKAKQFLQERCKLLLSSAATEAVIKL